MKALSIRQPWAWLILNAGKDVENRTWPSSHVGPVLIHASAGGSRREFDDAMNWIVLNNKIALDFEEPEFRDLERGGIVGVAEMVGCVTYSSSPWFTGPYGFFLKNAMPLPFRPLKGALKFFEVEP